MSPARGLAASFRILSFHFILFLAKLLVARDNVLIRSRTRFFWYHFALVASFFVVTDFAGVVFLAVLTATVSVRRPRHESFSHYPGWKAGRWVCPSTEVRHLPGLVEWIPGRLVELECGDPSYWLMDFKALPLKPLKYLVFFVGPSHSTQPSPRRGRTGRVR